MSKNTKLVAELYYDHEPHPEGRCVAHNVITKINGRGVTFEGAVADLRNRSRVHFRSAKIPPDKTVQDFKAEYLNDPIAP